MSQERAIQAAKMIRSNLPGPFNELVQYIQELQLAADEGLRHSVENTLLRQNQGKSQLCEELLKTLNT